MLKMLLSSLPIQSVIPFIDKVGTFVGAITFIVAAAVFIIYYLAKQVERKELKNQEMVEKVFVFLTKTEPLMGKIDKLMDLHAEGKAYHDKMLHELGALTANINDLKTDVSAIKRNKK